MQFTTFSGSPIPLAFPVGRDPYVLDVRAKGLNVRNTGINTLWVSIDDGKTWWDIASGTSLDALIAIDRMLLRTTVGATSAVVLLTT